MGYTTLGASPLRGGYLPISSPKTLRMMRAALMNPPMMMSLSRMLMWTDTVALCLVWAVLMEPR